MKPAAGLLLVLSLASTLDAQSTGRQATARPVVIRQSQVHEVGQVLAQLVESYGVSGMEAPVRATVERLLPQRVQRETDSAGNLWVSLGQGDPVVVFIATWTRSAFG
jgi:H2-forming N5,N10-methylenetetrahydromethanopterin dehydrogenase-like enzyme